MKMSHRVVVCRMSQNSCSFLFGQDNEIWTRLLGYSVVNRIKLLLCDGRIRVISAYGTYFRW